MASTIQQPPTMPEFEPAGGHIVQFYETDDFLIDVLSGFMRQGLRAGDACVVIATQAHRVQLETQLKAGGLDLAAARRRGTYRTLDAAEMLTMFMVEGLPDPSRFRESVGGEIKRAAKGGRSVRAFGEMVALLWLEGNPAAALRLEKLWN
ncbi:MAG TPA: MEDS domain-containing protein, partial [Ktedonobacterales bacterium]|nr:MEDS domain-containing protein [Ktedonobacterales bacterium]